MKRQNLIILLLNLNKDSQSISKNRLNLMQYTACLVFNPDTVKNFTFLFKFFLLNSITILFWECGGVVFEHRTPNIVYIQKKITTRW